MVGCSSCSTISFDFEVNRSVTGAELERRQSTETCFYCHAESDNSAGADRHVCGACGRIQPLESNGDYFSFFGLARLLELDEQALEKSFYSLSRRLHPDYFMTAAAEEQQASLDRASMLNDAYRTLREPFSRALYLLTLEGFKEAEKKAPPDLLEEVFELNMQIEELKAARKVGDESEAAEAREGLSEKLADLKNRQAQLRARLSELFRECDSASVARDETGRRRGLEKLSELLSHRSYIASLIREIEEEL